MRETRAARADRRAASLLQIVLLACAVACAARSPAEEAFPSLATYEGWEITAVRFAGGEPFSLDTLADLTETEPTRANLLGLPIHIFGLGLEREYLEPDVVYRDVARLTAYFRRSGYYGTTVEPIIVPVGDRQVEVEFAIALGPPILLGSLEITGTEGIVDPDELRRRIPLRTGELFNLANFAASADTILRALRNRGHMFAQVLRSYDLNLSAGVAVAELAAVPGPQVVVDSILILGTKDLSRRDVLRQLEFREGRVLRERNLIASERNLYSLELVQLASVAVAEDTLQVTPADSTTATVVVRVSEGPVHVVEAAVGFGTVDCLRAEANWVSRNFGGGGRRLALLGQVGKIGVGSPADLGLGGTICRDFDDDPFRNLLDYRFRADLTQPYFRGPRNSLGANLYAERQSEPLVFQRQAVGGGLTITRRLRPRQVLTTALDVERGRTIASQAVFCVTFQVCLPEDIADLTEPSWKNLVGASWVRDRTDRPLDPTRGSINRLALAWATPLLGSNVEFVRGTGEFSWYRGIGRDRVLALFLRLGSFFGTASVLDPSRDFLPPDERFYAGGAYSVRGYEQNALGPGVYVAEEAELDPVTGEPIGPAGAVDFAPIGGTAVIVANAELRVPGPFARDIVRLAFFVDAGAIGEEDLRNLSPGDLRFTPGAGVRIGTPVGPVRVDVAYNPYRPVAGPLFVPDPDTGALIRIRDDFRPGRPSFFDRFRFSLAIGQPF